ncbi:sulfurtransferase [Rhizobacter sp. Root1221]|uniref:sulfurtransferase n=1 Tax=Rhizobacter sp. Root1221 TaxID=1736433 RepID=UPI0006FA8C9E|nr:sulfurtransferase [Rhizobacter sp. Root1221]KQV93349.1 3-mercaptopyruvate sulfurtransferase [Rhizobacter sp. Root1221]
MNTPLISAANLRATTPAPLLLDCSFDLAGPSLGEQAYAAGHLPGALYVHLDRDLSGPKTGLNGRHPLRTREAYAGWMASIGITPDRDVVVYDRQAGMFAVRAWWVLRWLGHPRVALLDGGLDAWVRSGGELSTQVPVPSPVAASPAPAPAMPTIDATTLLGRLPGVRVLDARAPERYRGDVEPLDRVAGHIPGARNRFFKDNLQADGTFKPAAMLRAEYEALTAGATDVVLQCGSGVTACHDLIAMEVAGLGIATLYPGSWSEWSADPARPVERGTAV